MHLLLTDVIQHYGGSSELIKELNRVGAVSSEDTHGRLVTFISQQRGKEMEAEFNPQAFKLASVDNIDVLSQYAKAYAGKASNIWHGISIQCVEPKPKSLLISTDIDSSALVRDCANTSLAHQQDLTTLSHQQDFTALAHQVDTASLPLIHQDLTALTHQGDLTKETSPLSLTNKTSQLLLTKWTLLLSL